MNLRENYNKELQKVLQDEAKKAALAKGTVFSPKNNDTGNRTFNDQGFTIFVQKVKVEKLPKLDFEGSVLKYATTEQNVLKKKKKTERIKNAEHLETDPFDAIRGNENNDGYFFQPKIEQDNINLGVKCIKSDTLNG